MYGTGMFFDRGSLLCETASARRDTYTTGIAPYNSAGVTVGEEGPPKHVFLRNEPKLQ